MNCAGYKTAQILTSTLSSQMIQFFWQINIRISNSQRLSSVDQENVFSVGLFSVTVKEKKIIILIEDEQDREAEKTISRGHDSVKPSTS